MSWKLTVKGDPVLASIAQTRQQPAPLTNETKTLIFFSLDTAQKTLGHYKEPGGNQQLEQFRRIHKKSDEKTKFL